MELDEQQYSELPDYAKGAFAEVDGKYLPVKDAALKGTLDNLDREKKELAGKVGELTKAQENRMQELEKAKETARNEAIEEAKKSQNWEEQERLLREKFDDELKRDREATRGEVTKEFTVKQSQDSLTSDIKLLASELAVDDSAKPALEIMLGQRAKLDENGNRVYLGDDGSALSITELKAFKEEFANSPTVARLVKGKTTTQGNGLADGGSNNGSAGNVNAKAEEAKKRGDGIGALNARFSEHFNK